MFPLDQLQPQLDPWPATADVTADVTERVDSVRSLFRLSLAAVQCFRRPFWARFKSKSSRFEATNSWKQYYMSIAFTSRSELRSSTRFSIADQHTSVQKLFLAYLESILSSVRNVGSVIESRSQWKDFSTLGQQNGIDSWVTSDLYTLKVCSWKFTFVKNI